MLRRSAMPMLLMSTKKDSMISRAASMTDLFVPTASGISLPMCTEHVDHVVNGTFAFERVFVPAKPSLCLHLMKL